MLSGALIAATDPARCVNSASVAAAFSRIAWAKYVHNGSCASVMPSCDCNVRIRWSAAAWVAADGAGALDAGAAVGGVGAADCAKPIDGVSRAARATLRTSLAENMSALLGSAQLIVVAVAVAVTEAAASSLVPAPTMPASPTEPAL